MSSRTRTRKLTKPQRQRAQRVAGRAVRGAERALGQRLTDTTMLDVGGDPRRFFAFATIADRELEYSLWVWVTRRPAGEGER